MTRTRRGIFKGCLSFFTFLAFVVFPSASPALASTNCRQIMRDLQVQLTNINPDPNTSPTAQMIAKAQAESTAKLVAYPECQADFQILNQWNSGVDPNAPFPFGEAGDPRVYPLGPVSWWWDVIYISLFGKNFALMLFFGWEIFLGGLWAAIAIPLSLVSAILPAAGKLVAWPFRFLWRKPQD